MRYKNKEHNLILEFLLISSISILFWYFNGLFDGSGFGTDMGRYYISYLNLSSFSEILSKSVDPINYLIQYIFKLLGFSFYFFLLLVVFLFYKAGSYRLNNLFGKKLFILQIFTLIFYSLYFRPSILVALRQGLAILVIFSFCFQTINEKIGSKNFYKELLFVLFSSLLHLSSILVLPFIFLKKIFKKYTKLFNLFFFLVFALYSSGLYYKIAFFDNTVLEIFPYLFRSLSMTNAGGNFYVVGPTLKKSLSIILPILLIEITKKYYTNYQKIKLEPILLFFKYISIVAMLLSNLPYNDRVLMFGWAFIPIMMSLPFYIILKNIFFPMDLKLKS
jgi:hypothetical protein